MAQTLVEDRSYNLTGDENLKEKQVYFVKLTDSCLKAIEEYIIYKTSARSPARIKFEGQNGCISIPGKPSGSENTGKKFLFGLSSINQGQGAIECIKHPDRKTNELVSYGPLESKISINATEDVYENTRNRMAQVDQERKDVRTKEIKLNSGKKNRKQTKAKIITPEPSSHKPNIPVKKKLANSTHHQSSPSSHSQSVTSSTSRNSPAKTISRTNSPAISGKSFTCRERVIHILAVRPHKKPELIQRLNREAMSQKDRNNLAMVLQQVSSIQENQHKLQAHLYHDIQVDTWPFYNDHETNIVKKNIVQFAKEKKPEKLPSPPPQIKKPEKRQSPPPQVKKPEKRPSPPSQVKKPEKYTSPPQQVSSTSKSPEEKPKLDEKPSIKRPAAETHSTTAKRSKTTYEEPTSTVSSTNKPIISKEEISPSKKLTNKHTSLPVPPPSKKSDGQESPPTVASTSKTPEYLKNYKPIQWRETRRQYKLDFESEYPVYLRLKENVDAVKIKFIELQEVYRKTAKGTSEYERIEKKIMEAYEKLEDEKYHEQKRQYEELDQKLRYIKKLIVEYDNAMLASCE